MVDGVYDALCIYFDEVYDYISVQQTFQWWEKLYLTIYNIEYYIEKREIGRERAGSR